MRARRPQPGPSDQIKTPAQPVGGAARPDPANGTGSTNSASPHAPKDHTNLTALVRLLGRQVARDASSKVGRDD